MPHKYFTVEGVATCVQHRGHTTLPEVPPDLGQGEAVLCLHGTGSSASALFPILDGLARDHSPVAFDQPGHGRSGELDSLGSIDRMCDFTRALADRLALERPVLLGHSLGAAVALELALRDPDALRALILLACGPRFDLSDDVMDLHRRVAEGKERRPFQRELFSRAASPETMKRGFIEDLKTDPRARYGDLLACRAWNAEERLGSLSVPCLVLTGEDEQPATAKAVDALASRIPGARRAVIPKAGHLLHLEAPEAVTQAVVEFLGDLA